MVSAPVLAGKPSQFNYYTPQTPLHLRVEAQGQLFRVKHVDRFVAWDRTPKPPARERGDIEEFSKKSRKRLLDTFARLDKGKLKFAGRRMKFITLTYSENMRDAAGAKRHLDAFAKRLARLDPDSWFIWRMEYQKRGAIHFHLITSLSYVPVKELQAAWNAITGESAQNSLDLQVMRSFSGVMSYAAKYLGKREDSESSLGLSMCHNSPHEAPGRFWGVYGRQNVPWAARICFRTVVTVGTMIDYANSHPCPWVEVLQGFTVYGDAKQQLERLEAAYMGHEADNRAWGLLDRLNQPKSRDEIYLRHLAQRSGQGPP